MIRQMHNGIVFYQFEHLADFPDLVHGIFTRRGGRSRPPYDSLNITMGLGDTDSAVSVNRRLVAKSLGFNDLVLISQVHGTKVVCSEKKRRLKAGAAPIEGDALATDRFGDPLAIQVADCQAILLYDPHRRVVANIHAGWRGSITGIIGNAVRAVASHFGSDPGDLMGGIGPSLGPCCAEFVHYRREIPREFWGYKDNRHHFNFWDISRDQLLDAGVPASNIRFSGMCTRCQSDLFFSYRAAHVTGRFAAVIGMQNHRT